MIKKISMFFLCGLINVVSAKDEMIKVREIAFLENIRTNQLIGYGVVSGLDGTGDTNSSLTNDSTNNLLKSLGINIPVGNNSFKNVAIVTLTAEIPAFSRIGQKIDVTVSSIGSAKSLKSGVLMLTQLKGVDGQVYALAQGNVITSENKGSQLVGIINDGATIEKEVLSDLSALTSINLTLKNADFGLIQQIKQKLKDKLNISTTARDSRVLNVPLPDTSNEKVSLLASVMDMQIEQHQMEQVITPKIFINTKTNTVITNQAIYLNHCQMNIGNISLTVNNKLKSNTEIVGDKIIAETNQPDIHSVVSALRKTGATIQDIINVIQALKKSQCIQAEIDII